MMVNVGKYTIHGCYGIGTVKLASPIVEPWIRVPVPLLFFDEFPEGLLDQSRSTLARLKSRLSPDVFFFFFRSVGKK